MNDLKGLPKRAAASVALIAMGACSAAGAARTPPKTSTSPTVQETTMRDESVATVEKIIQDMEAAFARKDLEALSALFTEDATLESFLVARILKRPEGVCHGKKEVREVLQNLVEHGVPWGGHAPPLVRGNMAAVEFKTRASDQDTFSVDILEIQNGKIKSLRAYAGWRAMPGPP